MGRLAPEKRRYRPFIAICLLLLLLTCLVATALVGVHTGDLRLTLATLAPTTLIGGLLKMSMMWFSTPAECALIARPGPVESFVALARELFGGKGGGPGPPGPPS